MALNFNFAQVSEWQKLHSDNAEWAKTEHIIWHTMAVHLNAITEKNWEKFAQRYFAWHKLHNTPANGKVSVDDIKRRIGLRTNVTNKTDAQFRKLLADSVIDW
jgi:hypothetical protein